MEQKNTHKGNTRYFRVSLNRESRRPHSRFSTNFRVSLKSRKFVATFRETKTQAGHTRFSGFVEIRKNYPRLRALFDKFQQGLLKSRKLSPLLCALCFFSLSTHGGAEGAAGASSIYSGTLYIDEAPAAPSTHGGAEGAAGASSIYSVPLYSVPVRGPSSPRHVEPLSPGHRGH